MENRKNSNSILLTIIGAATLLVAIIGASFAYFSASNSVTSDNITTGVLKVSASVSSVTNKDIKPVKGTEITEISEKLTNADIVQLPISVNTTGTTIDAFYNIYLTTTGLEEVPTVAEKEGETGIVSHINWLLASKKTEGDSPTYTKVGEGTFGGDMTNHKLNDSPISITANKNATDEYVLLIWIEENDQPQNDLQSLTINASATVEANQATANLPAGDGN